MTTSTPTKTEETKPKSLPFLCQCTIHEDSNPPDLTNSSGGDANMVLLDAREWHKSKVMIGGLIAGMLLQGSFLVILPNSALFSIILTRFLNYLFGILSLVSLLWNMAKIGKSTESCKLFFLILSMATLSGALLQCVLFSSFLDIPENVLHAKATQAEKQVAQAMMMVQKAVEFGCIGMTVCAFIVAIRNSTGRSTMHTGGFFATLERLAPWLRHGIVLCASTSVGSLLVVLAVYMTMGRGTVGGATSEKANEPITLVEFSAFVSLVVCYGVLVLTVWIQEVIANQEMASDEKDKNGDAKDEYEMVEYVFVC